MRRLAAGTGGSIVVERCQSCDGGTLEPILFLGYLPPVNTMPLIGSRPAEQPAYPAQLLRCPRCELVQLGLVVDPRILFPPDYPYTSGTTQILRENFADLAREANELLGLAPGDLVVDIGSNDGTLLLNFLIAGQRVRGIEPTDTAKLAEARGIPTLLAFFGPDAVRSVLNSDGHARVVTAANVFAHVEDVHSVIEGILDLLDRDGIFICESHYWVSLLETLQYDTIYHEHLRYYSLTSLRNLLRPHGLEVFDAHRIASHGGSIRVYVAKEGVRPVRSRVGEILAHEAHAQGPDALDRFRRGVVGSKLALHALLAGIKGRGERIYGIGAPSRASTLVNYVGLDDLTIDAICEVAGSHKIGRYMPGTLIPVVDEELLFRDQPEHALFFSWHIADELSAKLRGRGFGGDQIVPLPIPRILVSAA